MLQSWTKYLTLDFMWNRHTMGKVQFLFFSNFLQVLATFTFWEEDWALGYNSMKSRDFPEMSYFPKIRSFQVIRQLVTQLVYTTVNINAYTPLHLWQKKKLLKYKKSQISLPWLYRATMNIPHFTHFTKLMQRWSNIIISTSRIRRACEVTDSTFYRQCHYSIQDVLWG